MFTSESRPLTDAEGQRLRKRIRGVGRRLAWEPLFSAVFTVVVFVFVVPTIARDSSWSLPVRWLAIAAFVLCYAAVGSAMPASWRDARAERRNLRAALDEGRVEVTRYEACGAVNLVDEVPGWIFDLGGGELLYLRGIEAYPEDLDDTDRWPNTRFETSWVPEAGIWLRTEVLGGGLPESPLAALSELDPELRSRLETPAEGADVVQKIVPGRLPDLPARPAWD